MAGPPVQLPCSAAVLRRDTVMNSIRRSAAVAAVALALGAASGARARGGTHLIKPKPLGRFEAGAALNGKWGRASRKLAAQGISAGSSRTLVFDVNGAAAGMTVNDFLTGNVNIAAAFRGRKADKVGGVIVPTTPSSPPVLPGPGDNDGGSDTPPIIVIEDGGQTPPPGGVIIPPVIIGDDNGNGGNQGGPTAVPLPPAVWSGLLGLGAIALPRLEKRP